MELWREFVFWPFNWSELFKAFLENASYTRSSSVGVQIGLCPIYACSFSLKGKGQAEETRGLQIKNGIVVNGAVLFIAKI